MRPSRSPRSRLAALLVLAASGAMAAPDLTPSPSPTADTNLSPSQMLTQAREYVAKMQDSYRTMAQLQEGTKKSKDIIKLNCVNDKLLQVKGLLAVTDQAMSSLNEAVAKNDDDGRSHQYTRVTILYQKVLVLGTEANNCVGEDIAFVGDVERRVDEDPSIPKTDPTAFDVPGVDPGRPPAASVP